MPAVHVLDEFGLILHSNISNKTSLTGEEIIGTYAADHLEASQSLKYLSAIETCLNKGYAHFEFKLIEQSWFCIMDKISDRRVRVKEWCIDGMRLEDILRLF